MGEDVFLGVRGGVPIGLPLVCIDCGGTYLPGCVIYCLLPRYVPMLAQPLSAAVVACVSERVGVYPRGTPQIAVGCSPVGCDPQHTQRGPAVKGLL